MSDRTKRRRGLSSNPWVREQESRRCRHPDCGALPGKECITIAGAIAARPHAERWNEAMAARGLPFRPKTEGRWVAGRSSWHQGRPRPEPPPSRYDAGVVAAILAKTAALDLINDLEYRRWTGRPGYPVRSLVGAFVTRDAYRLRSLTQAVRLIARHQGLQEVLRGDYTGLPDAADVVPSADACYRLARLLRSEPDLAAVAADLIKDKSKEAFHA